MSFAGVGGLYGMPGSGGSSSTPGALGSPAAWRRVMFIDLTAQPSTALTPDGTFNIAGVSFKTKQSAGPAMVQTNGTGITFTPPNPAQYTTGLRTLPQLWMQVAQAAVAPSFDISMPMRVWGKWADDPAVLNCYQDVGLDTSDTADPATVAGGGWSSSSLRGFDTSNGNVAGAGEGYARHVLAGQQTDLAQSLIAIPGGLVAANRVLVAEANYAIGHVTRCIMGPTVPGLPAYSTLSYIVGALQTVGTQLKPVPASAVGAYWGAERVNAAAFTTVLQAIAVDLFF
jgi:hypothetical protein